jgi:hypothetical protein
MEILTVTCERDIHDFLLQIDSISKFIETPCTHLVAIEDGSKSYDEWYEILSPYYTKHTLKLFWFERPDLDYSSEFRAYPHRPDAKSGTGGLGWRRQQILKMQLTALNATTDQVLVLDSKNIFVRPTDLSTWPVKHGNGEYLPYEEILGAKELITIKNWLHYLRDDHGLTIPEKFAMILETPFVWQTKIVQDIWSRFDIPGMFMNKDVVPNSEFHMYFFFVDPAELGQPMKKICRVVLWTPNDSWDKYITKKIEECEVIESPTHGLHRQTRQDMPIDADVIYENWLTNKGLDAKLVSNYIQWCK